MLVFLIEPWEVEFWQKSLLVRSPNCQECPKAIGLRNLGDAQWWSRSPCRLSLSCCPLLVEPAWSPLVVDRPAAEDSLLLLLRHPLVHERANLLCWVKLIPAGASNLWLLLRKVSNSELAEMQKVIKIAEINFWPNKISTKKWPKNNLKWPKIAQKLPKIAQNGPKMNQNRQNGPKISTR